MQHAQITPFFFYIDFNVLKPVIDQDTAKNTGLDLDVYPLVGLYKLYQSTTNK